MTQTDPQAPPLDGVYTQTFVPRYYEIDGQGVMFNMWYLGYVDAAVDGFFEARGLPHAEWLDGLGVQAHVAHAEIDWASSVRYTDRPDVLISPSRIGGKSFTLDFAFRRDGETIATGCAVYVTVAADGSGTTPLPDGLVKALGEVRPLRAAKPA
ncbi:acyl-CoA thioesterase [Actinomadura rupiterrae]|uniref:acyl-CoA thioesterase n=1 Tax=Actinomadura rupiterrae TaxID=559627 RepID=UPI0020A24EA8|nr:thioesterase family protein [Actinomadura rupiterrae]MCP2342759.1 acyl-CoA thioester hydrolase [Actinomadura rupiterrae]